MEDFFLGGFFPRETFSSVNFFLGEFFSRKIFFGWIFFGGFFPRGIFPREDFSYGRFFQDPNLIQVIITKLFFNFMIHFCM